MAGEGWGRSHWRSSRRSVDARGARCAAEPAKPARDVAGEPTRPTAAPLLRRPGKRAARRARACPHRSNLARPAPHPLPGLRSGPRCGWRRRCARNASGRFHTAPPWPAHRRVPRSASPPRPSQPPPLRLASPLRPQRLWPPPDRFTPPQPPPAARQLRCATCRATSATGTAACSPLCRCLSATVPAASSAVPRIAAKGAPSVLA